MIHEIIKADRIFKNTATTTNFPGTIFIYEASIAAETALMADAQIV